MYRSVVNKQPHHYDRGEVVLFDFVFVLSISLKYCHMDWWGKRVWNFYKLPYVHTCMSIPPSVFSRLSLLALGGGVYRCRDRLEPIRLRLHVGGVR